MRPVLTGGLQRGVHSRIHFDPVNTLLIAMVGEELRRPTVRSLLDLSNATKRRMMQIYDTLRTALPGDPSAAQYQQLLRRATSTSLARDTHKVFNALVKFAKANESKEAEDSNPDRLTNQYLRVAAKQARIVDRENQAKALLLAMGIFMDDTETLRKFPATRKIVNAIESEPQRRDRLLFRGNPTMRGRSDWAKHFFVSAHLTVVLGTKPTKKVGFAKEVLDAQNGTGFSFADMAANQAGIVFAEQLLKGKISLDRLAQNFSTEAYLPPIDDLEEGLASDELQEQYGGGGNNALEIEFARIERRILQLPAYKH